MVMTHIQTFMWYMAAGGLVVLLTASVHTTPRILAFTSSKAGTVSHRRHGPHSAQMRGANGGVLAPDIVIMGFGDSGTRGVKKIMHALGLAMCHIINNSGDNLLTEKTHAYIPELLQAAKGQVSSARGYMSSKDFLNVVQAELFWANKTLQCAMGDRGLSGESLPTDVKWGFKNPKHIYMLPVMDVAFHGKQNMLAVARDPRDLCTAHNQRQFHHFGDIVLRNSSIKNRGTRCLEFWSAVWTSVLQEYAHNEKFLIVRIEDLVIHDPTTSRKSYETLGRVVELAGISPSTDDMLKQLEIAHRHKDSYMGNHYGKSKEDRKREEESTASASHRVHEVMLAIGYNVTHYGLTRPQHPRVISPWPSSRSDRGFL
mmetsp:Transcript_67030/g.196013  ORF Transcript_67030/g.196013 Transcript_67030/m.196013 type:complete len:371 (+) Transcript_67030:74-1186(+)